MSDYTPDRPGSDYPSDRRESYRDDRDDPYGRDPYRPDYEDRPLRRPIYGRRGGPEWTAFKVGVTLLTVAVLGDLVLELASIGLALLNQYAHFLPLFAVGRLVLGLMAFVSLCLFCAAPSGSGVAGYAWGTLGCLIAFVLLVIGVVVLTIAAANREFDFGDFDFRNLNEGMSVLFCGSALIGVILLLAAYICLAGTLSSAATALGDQNLSGGFVTYFVLAIVLPLVLGGLAMVLLMGMVRGGGGDTALLMGLGMVCGAIILYIALPLWFFSLLLRLRNLM
jgi:hypothetical protein